MREQTTFTFFFSREKYIRYFPHFIARALRICHVHDVIGHLSHRFLVSIVVVVTHAAMSRQSVWTCRAPAESQPKRKREIGSSRGRPACRSSFRSSSGRKSDRSRLVGHRSSIAAAPTSSRRTTYTPAARPMTDARNRRAFPPPPPSPDPHARPFRLSSLSSPLTRPHQYPAAGQMIAAQLDSRSIA